MISENYRGLLGKLNANKILGYEPRTVLVIDWRSGGGFSGAPEELWLVEAPKNLRDLYDQAELPEPHSGLIYHIGGRMWGLSDQSIVAHTQARKSGIEKN